MLEKVRINDPSTYLRVAAILVPKEMRLEVEQKNPGGLDADAYAALRRLLDITRRQESRATHKPCSSGYPTRLRSRC